MLPDIVRLLHDRGISRESDGAEVVFFDDNESLSGNPAIVRKRDGAYNYMTTDVATLKHREDEYSPELIVYVTDSRQQLHFRQLFEIAKRLGWKTELAHVWFGTILGDDGRPFKTRTGEPPRLADLLDEAQKRAHDVIKQAGADLPSEDEEEVARIVGVGALKYMDLAQNRTSDYVFSYDRMLALDGNTAPYIQYSYARTKSILRKYEDRFGPLPEGAAILIPEPAERDLALLLARFPEVIRESARTFYPHVLTDYLYSLATTLNKKFYHSVPVLQSESPVRESRLALCTLVARTLQCGLGLLGIEVPERM
jgi:arginyl-tRNA synthetase